LRSSRSIITRQNALPERSPRGEEVGPVEQPGERVHRGQLDRRVPGASLLPPDRRTDVGEQVHAGQAHGHLDERGRGRIRAHEEARAEVRGGGQDRQRQRDPRRHEQCARPDHQREGEGERTLEAAGEHDQRRRERQGEQRLERAREAADDGPRQHVLQEQRREPGDGDDDDDRGQDVRPQAARSREYRDGHQERPADDPDHPAFQRRIAGRRRKGPGQDRLLVVGDRDEGARDRSWAGVVRARAWFGHAQ
jgi:hypothetical protein